MKPHYVDNSRYMSGFSCPFIRYAKYHLLGTGYVSSTEPAETWIGHSLHTLAELLLSRHTFGTAVSKEEVNAILDPVPLLNHLVVTSLMHSEIKGLVHGWARAILPWLQKDHILVSIEEEFSIDLGDGIVWMARPDFILRHRTTNKLVVCDFKSTRSKAERVASIHSNSLQQIMNAYAVSNRYGEPVVETQLHMLQIGTEQWPTPITHAYYRPGQPPYVSESWEPRSRRPNGTWVGKLYKRVPVHEHRPVEDWVWEMPPDPLRECVPVLISEIDPEIHGLKVIEALSSIRANETHWKRMLASLKPAASFAEISKTIPRTFSCIQYDRVCEYSNLCFTPHVAHGSPDAATLQDMGLIQRTPHHPQERENS